MKRKNECSRPSPPARPEGVSEILTKPNRIMRLSDMHTPPPLFRILRHHPLPTTHRPPPSVSHFTQRPISDTLPIHGVIPVVHPSRSSIFGFIFFGVLISGAYAQTPNTVCVTSATPLVVRSEGLSERAGQILYDCTGTPNTQIQVNLAIALNVNITNRLSSGNTLTGIIFTIDTGSGPQAVTIPPLLQAPGTLVYNGVNFTLSPTGKARLNINNIRGNATQIGPFAAIIANLGVNGNLLLTIAFVVVRNPQRSLFSSLSGRLVCAQSGAKLPDTITFSSLINFGAVFTS